MLTLDPEENLSPLLHITVFLKCWPKISGKMKTDVSRESVLLKYLNEPPGFYSPRYSENSPFRIFIYYDTICFPQHYSGLLCSFYSQTEGVLAKVSSQMARQATEPGTRICTLLLRPYG